MDRIYRNRFFLKKLIITRNFQELLFNSSDDEILSIVEICFNLIRFRAKCSKAEILKLKKYSSVIRSLAKTRSRKSAQRILKNIDYKFFPLLFNPILKQL